MVSPTKHHLSTSVDPVNDSPADQDSYPSDFEEKEAKGTAIFINQELVILVF